MELLKRLFEVIPIPVIAAIGIVITIGWLFRELRGFPDYGPVLRDPYFQSVVVVSILFLLGYYAMSYIFSQETPFNANERGVVVAKFSHDEKNTVQTQTVESLRDKLESLPDFRDVHFKRIDNFEDQFIGGLRGTPTVAGEQASTIKDLHATSLIWGSFRARKRRPLSLVLARRKPNCEIRSYSIS
jgi:hypothetical protein